MNPDRRLSDAVRISGRSRPLVFRVVSCLVSAAAFLMAVLLIFSSRAIPGAWPEKPKGAALFISTGDQPAGRFRILQAGLSMAGFASSVLAAGPESADPQSILAHEIDDLSRLSGCQPEDIWLIADGGDALFAWQAAGQAPRLGGLMLICPDGLSQMNVAALSDWPEGRSAAILTGGSPGVSPESNGQRVFEILTGEDATLLPPFREKGPGRPWQYTSADGLIHLAIYPCLPESYALLSTRVLTDAAAWLDGWSGQPSPPVELAKTGQTLIGWIFKLFLAGLLLFAVPPFLVLGISAGKPADRSSGFPSDRPTAAQADDPALKTRRQEPVRKIWIELLLWIPAVALSGAIGLLAGRISGGQCSLAFGLLVLPGARGWLSEAASRVENRLIRGRRKTNPAAHHAIWSPWLPVSLFIVGCLGAAAVFWSALAFGSFLAAKWAWFTLPVLILVNFPAGRPEIAAMAARQLRNGLPPRSPWPDFLWSHLPFILLTGFAALTGDLSFLAACALLMVLSFWAESCGKAVTRMSGSTAVGLAAQSFAYSLGALLPPVFNTLASIKI